MAKLIMNNSCTGKSFRFDADCAEVIPKTYIDTSSGELKCKVCRSWHF